ncbi:MAG: sulfatase-like hydrolase/transferase [Clostridiaceae bacterium]|nr:sulfatase-like hydrolase/transferase [Clostridiaceae bacterium]
MKHQPNILLIMAEKMRYDCIGSSRMRLSHTPYLDWLAGNGVWFEQAYTPHPNFSLALSTLLSGRRFNADRYFPHEFRQAKDEDSVSFQGWSSWLREQNWPCSWLGEWRMQDSKPEDFGYNTVKTDAGPNPMDLAQAAAEWLRANGQQGLPWHLCLSFPDFIPSADEQEAGVRDIPMPPWPNFVDDMKNKPRAQQRLQERNATLQNLWSDWSDRASNSNRQAGRIDEALGQLVAQINQMGLLEDTLIIFTAASGSMCGSHRLVGNEYCCYDEIMRVPMLLHWPGVIPAGLRCEKLVSSLLDIPATLTSLLQGETPDEYQGFDLSCYWQEQQTEETNDACRRDGILSSQLGLTNGLYTQRMYRDSRYKLVWNPTDIDEFYDLQKDPYELVNRIGDDSEQEIRLKKLMLEEMIKCGDPMVQALSQELKSE